MWTVPAAKWLDLHTYSSDVIRLAWMFDLFFLDRRHSMYHRATRPIATAPTEMPTPRPIFVPLLSPETPSPSVFPVDEGNGDGSDNVDTGLVDVVDAVDEVSVVEAGADVIGVEVAPMGVNKELVTTAVLRVAGDPTRSAYGGKKSLISCVH